ncbi:MAG TPA: Rieske (2Fe-2S) protein [Acidimicrobiia bacterium]
MSRRPAGLAAEWVIVGCFTASTLGGIGLAITYALGGQPQLEGVLLGIALLGLGVGLIAWAHRFLPHGPFEEEREELGAGPVEEEALEADIERGGVLTRRRLIVGGLTGALGALTVAFLFPIRSLGPAPGGSLFHTPWRAGSRAITDAGRPVLAASVPTGGLVTVFPDGHPDSADGQVVLVRVDPDQLRLPAGRRGWAPNGLIAYSKVCTHAGCPVGLYEARKNTLLCPCHQSSFDVLTGGNPVLGPAARALPQLPIAIDAQGYVIAQSDFDEPIGPTFWNRDSR